MTTRRTAALPARAKGRRRPQRRPRMSRLLAWLLAAWLGGSGWALAQGVAVGALPTGGKVVVGAGQLAQNGNLLVIQQSTQKLGLDWQSFNIGSGATVEFRQPGASSIALNRVLSNTGTEIYGQLKANGQVFLTNPNGVLFAPGARVDVGGLVASTLDLSQQDFADGKYAFRAGAVTGSVVNQGTLRATAGGYLALFGTNVVNAGDIAVDAGSVVLASGRAATVSISGSGLLSAVVTPGTVPGSVDNSGRISADGGVVTLSAKSAQDIAASLVNNSGVIRANTLVERSGEIWITGDNVSTSGTLSASAPAGGDAGSIRVLADMQHGTAQVGGTLDASAASGQGGFVETSAAHVQVADGTRVTTYAPNGQTGTWLIDPNDFTIAASGGNITGSALSDSLNGVAGGPAGTSVVISTATQGTAGGNGDIFVNDTVSWSANKLTLRAERNIAVNTSMNGSGAASLAFEYGQASVFAGNTATVTIAPGASVALPAGNSFSTKLGSDGSTANGGAISFTVLNTLSALQGLDDGTAATLGGKYALGADIDASSTKTANGGLGFNPIGNQSSSSASTTNSFSGVFDGLGHSISQLTIARPSAVVASFDVGVAVGLFANANNAVLRNFTLVDAQVTGATYVGAALGIGNGSSSLNNVALVQTSSGGASVSSASTSSPTSVGGLVGYNTSGSISNSRVGASGSLVTVSGGYHTGGVAGYGGSGAISNSHGFVAVSGSGVYVGGLAGRTGGSVSDSDSAGTVQTSGNAYVGGLVGMADGSGSLTNVGSTADVSSSNAGSYVGGVIGEALNKAMTTVSRSAGSVSGGTRTGGAVGYFASGSATGSNAVAISGATVGGSVTGIDNVGGIIGYADGTGSLKASTSSATVSTTATGANAGGAVGFATMSGGLTGVTVTAAGTVSGKGNVGGLVGQASISIDSSSAAGAVTNTNTSNGGTTGGLVGYQSGSSISASTATGAVTGGASAGGLVGQLGGSSTSIAASTATGDVSSTSTNADVGGLVGFASGNTISTSTATGNVQAASNANRVGGLVGYASLTGGIVNSSSGKAANGSTAASTVTGGNFTGGLVGWYDSTLDLVTDAATSKLVTFKGASVSGGNYVGGLVGYVASSSKITGVTVGAAVNASGNGAVGGLVGYTGANVSGSVANGAVTATGSGVYVGGLVGQLAASGSITGTTAAPTTATGVVTALNTTYDVGGLVGYATGSGSISGTSATGSVNAPNGDGVGGLVGQTSQTGGIVNSSAGKAASGSNAASTVTGGTNTGGLVGHYQSAVDLVNDATAGKLLTFYGSDVSGDNNVGGLVGQSSGGASIAGATVSASATGTGSVGGLIGSMSGTAAKITDSTAKGAVTGASSSANAGGAVGSYSGGGGMTNARAEGVVSGGSNTGGLVGYYASTSLLKGGQATGATVTGTGYAGGLVGQGYGLSIEDAVASGAVTGTASVGGLVGWAQNSNTGGGTIKTSTANGTTVQGTGYTGGLAGWLDGFAVTGSTANGNVSATGTSDVGGLVGRLGTYYGGSIGSSVANGNVTHGGTSGTAGGLVGYSNGSITSSTANGSTSFSGSGTVVGGLVGYSNGSVTSSTANGAVSASGTSVYVGGLVGYLYGSITGTSAAPTTAVGDVTAPNTTYFVGGLVGYADGSGGISGTSATGSVSAPKASGVGGLVGYTSQAGGIVNSSAGKATNGSTAASTVSGGTNYAGGLVGYYGSAVDLVTGIVAGNSVTVAFNGSSVTGGGITGGLVGLSNGGAGIVGVTVSASVSGATDVGGLVGNMQGTAAKITNSTAKGMVTSSSSSNSVGGLAGYYGGGGGMTTVRAEGVVSGGSSTGGLVGYYSSNSLLKDGQATGATVTGTQYTGGLVGQGSQLSIENGTAYGAVTGTSDVGGLVGYALNSNTGGGTIKTSTAYGAVKGTGSVGGFAGWLDGFALTTVTANGDVTAIGDSSSAGGLVGDLSSYYYGGSITTGKAYGKVTAAGSTSRAGGLVGGIGCYYAYYNCTYSPYNPVVSISGSTAYGNVFMDATTATAGGLVGGVATSQGSISGSVAKGSVTGQDSTNSNSGSHYTGGLVGYFQGSTISNSSAEGAVAGRYYTGGLVGSFSSSTSAITDSFTKTTSTVSGTTYVGGLVGNFYGATITNSTAAGAVTGTGYVGGLAGYAQVYSTALSGNSASGDVTMQAGSGNYSAGGLVGYLAGWGISKGFASGKVTAPANASYVGGLVGYGGATSSAGTGTRAIDDSSATGAVSGGINTGGLVGQYDAGSLSGGITNSRAFGAVAATGSGNTGGLVGYYYGGSVSNLGIAASYATGNVAGGTSVGGLVGQMYSYKGISTSYATGNVTGGFNSTTYLGGLVGQYYAYAYTTGWTPLSASYASGDVSLATGLTLGSNTSVYVGGLVGYLSSSSVSAVAAQDVYATGGVTVANTSGQKRGGGLIGYANAGVLRSYAAGAVSVSSGSNNFAGGLIGQRNSSATIASSFWDTEASVQASSAGGTGLTSAQMLQSSSFSSWGSALATTGNAGKTWRIYEGQTRPLLTALLTPLGITLANASKTYDGTSSFGDAVITDSAGKAVSLPSRIFTSAASPDVGSYAITASGIYSQQNGYDLTVAGSATLTVNARPLTLQGVVADKVYDATTTATLVGTAQPFGLVAGEDLLVNTSAVTANFSDKNVGTGKTVTLSGFALADGSKGKASNYSLASATSSMASITQAVLTAGSFSAANRDYDGSTQVAVTATSATLSGVMAADTGKVSVDLSSVATGTMADKNVGTGKAVTVLGALLSGSESSNYRIGGIDNVSVNIAPLALTVNGLTAPDKTYDTTKNVTVNTAGGLVSAKTGDLVQLVSNTITGTMADKNVANGKTVTVGSGLQLRGPDAANYSLVAGPVTVNVLPATVYLYAQTVGGTSGTNKVYDGSAAANVTVQLLYKQGSDDLTLSYNAPAYADKNVAYSSGGNVNNKPIVISGGALSGADKNNYTLNTTSYGTVYGTISPKSLTVTGISAVDRVYDGTNKVVVNVSGAAIDTTGVVTGDQVFAQVPTNPTVDGFMIDKNVSASPKAVTVAGFGLTGADKGNYTVTGTGGLTVNISKLGITANYAGINKVYDGGANAAVSVSSAGVLTGDQIYFYANSTSYCGTGCGFAYFATTGSTPGSFTADKNAGTGKTVVINANSFYSNYGGGLFGTDAGNYTILNPTATVTANITPKPLSNLSYYLVNASGNSVSSRVYDGTDSALVKLNFSYGSDGPYPGDQVSATQTAVFSAAGGGKNVGTNKAIAVSNIALSGTDAGNYTLASNATGSATGSITQKAVTFSGITAVDRVYDGSTTVAVNASGVTSTGFIGTDNVSFQQPAGGLSSGTIASKGVGTGKTVTVTGLTLAGTDKDNYLIDTATSGIQVNISARPLTVSYAGGSRAYDGGVSAPVTASSADLIGTDTIVFSQSAVFTGLDGRNAGTGKAISISNISLSGTDQANYSLQNTTASATGSITGKSLTVAYTATGRVYNGLADTSVTVTGSSNDIVPGDLLSFAQTASFAGDGAAGLGKQVNVSGITLSGAQKDNYALTSTTATTTGDIAKRPIGVTGITAQDRVYDGSTLVNVTVVNATVNTASVVVADIGNVAVQLPPSGISQGSIATKDVGASKVVQLSGLTISGSAAANYTAVGASGVFVNITPRPLTAAYSAANKVYDGTAKAQIGATSADILSADIGGVGITASGSFADGKGAGLGKSVLVSGGFLTGAQLNNYSLQNPTATVTADILPKELTPTYNGGSKVYDGTAAAPVTATTAGILAGDTVSFGQTAVFSAGKNAGTGLAIAISNIVPIGADAANYTLKSTTASATGSITPKSITVSGLGAVAATDRVYNGSDVVQVSLPSSVTLVPNSADILTGDDVTIGLPSTGFTTGTMVNKNAGNNKAVNITGLLLSGTDKDNYAIAGAAGITVNIAPLSLVASYTGVTRAYDGSASVAVQGSSAGVLTGDLLTISGSGVFTGSGAKNAGTGKAIQVNSAGLSGSDSINYTLTNTTGSAFGTVTPKTITASYQPASKVYDGNASISVVATEAGVLSTDDLSFSQTATFTGSGAKNVAYTSGGAVTSKALSITGIALTGADKDNYQLTATTLNTTGTITPRAITLTGLTGVLPVDRIYNGSTSVDVNVTTSGVVAPTPGDILSTDNVIVNVPGPGLTTGTMANKNVGNNKALVSVAGLGISGTDAGNYTLVGASGLVVNITPKPITATYTGQNKVYDGLATASVLAASTGIVGGDSVSFSPTAVFTGDSTGAGAKNVGTSKAVSVTATSLGGTDAANYSLVNPTGSTAASITPKTVTVSYANTASKIYDGTTAAPVASTISGLIGGDTVSVSQTALFTSNGTGISLKGVGDGKVVDISSIALGGSDAPNYQLGSTTASAKASIAPKPLTLLGLTGITATDRAYDNTNVVGVTVATSGAVTPNSADLVLGDTVIVSLPSAGTTTGTMADRFVGSAKPVTVTGFGLGGADGGNYVIANGSAVTVNITPKLVTASYSGGTRVYDGTTAVTLTASSADLYSSDAVGIAASGQFSGIGAKNAGSGKLADVLSAALTGSNAFNYTLLNTTGTTTGSITQRSVTAVFTGGNKVYDGNATAPVTGSSIDFIAGDGVTLSASGTFTGSGGKNVAYTAGGAVTSKPVSVSGITLSGADAGNYSLVNTTASTTGTITPKLLGVNGLTSIGATDRAYDGTTNVNIAVQASGTLSVNAADIVPGDVVTVALPSGGVSAGTIADKHVGTAKAVSVAGLTPGGADGGNYVISAVAGLTVNITPRLVNATYVGLDKVYDGSATAQIGGLSSDILSGDLVTVGGSGVFSAGKGVGTAKAISITGGTLLGADKADYQLVNPTGSATASITPKLVTASYTGGTRVYDGSTSAAVIFSSADLLAGDAVTVSQTALFTGSSARNAGSGKPVDISNIALSGADAVNYALNATTAKTTAEVTKRPVNVSGLGNVTAVDRVYDGSTSVQITVSGSGGTASGNFLPTDDVAILVPSGGLNAGLLPDKSAGTNRPVAVAGLTLTGTDKDNYQIYGTVGVTVNIAPKPVVLLGVSAVDRAYDGTTAVAISTSGGSISGVLSTDSVSLPSSGVSGSMADKHAGAAKPVTVSGLSLAGSDAANYVVTAGGSGLTVNITSRPITLAVAASDKVYDGGTAATVTVSSSGVIAGDAVTLGSASASFADKGAANGKTVTVSGFTLGGADAADYSLPGGGTLTTTANILRASLAVTADSLSKVYGETVNLSGSEFTTVGLVAGETIGQVALASAGTAAVANAGSYAISAQQASGGSFDPANYTLSYSSGKLTVTPRPVTITGKTVVRTTDEANPSYFGVSSLEGVSVASGGLLFGDALSGALLTAPAGSATAPGGTVLELLPSNAQFAAGVTSSNYTLRYVNGLLVVLPKPPRIGETEAATGGGGGEQALAVQVEQAELERALSELERAAQLTTQVRAASEPAPGNASGPASAPAAGSSVASAATAAMAGPAAPLAALQQAAEAAGADITVALAGDSRRITLPALLKLPLLSFDPTLRRLIFGAPAAAP